MKHFTLNGEIRQKGNKAVLKVAKPTPPWLTSISGTR